MYHAARESFPVMRSGSVGCSGVEDMVGEGMWVVVGWKDVVGREDVVVVRTKVRDGEGWCGVGRNFLVGRP